MNNLKTINEPGFSVSLGSVEILLRLKQDFSVSGCGLEYSVFHSILMCSPLGSLVQDSYFVKSTD
jgi:hypothetical protein